MFDNPYWHSLLSEHAAIALGGPAARRFPADVIPFAGMPTPNAAGMAALRDLLAPGETIYVTGDRLHDLPGIQQRGQLPGWQMHYDELHQPNVEDRHSVALPVRELHAGDAAAMVALTDVAFPGFFRPRTYILGRYFGIERDGELVAMAGERLALPGYREISAVCTHPAHLGRGHAAALIQHLLRIHSAAGLRSFLHVVQSNHRAIALYDRLGFIRSRSILFHALRRA